MLDHHAAKNGGLHNNQRCYLGIRSDNTLKPTGLNSADHNQQQQSGESQHNQKPKCELSIPSLSDVASKCVGSYLSKFQQLKEDQIDFELAAMNKVTTENDTIKG